MAKQNKSTNSQSETCPFGARMMVAREMAGLSQLEVFELLGFKNSSRLCKIEYGEHSNYISFPLLKAATKLYKTSADYLLGLTDTPNTAPDEIIRAKVQKLLPKLMAGEEARIRSIAAALDKIAALVERNEARTKELLAAINRFRELNPGFDDMPGGAKLERIISEARYEAKRGAEELIQLRNSLKQI